MNWHNSFLIFKNTLNKEIRSKVLLFLGALSIGVILLTSTMLQYFSAEVLTSTGMDGFGNTFLGLFFFVITWWISFLAVFLGVNTVRTDLETQVAPQLLSFPIKRYEYLLARIFGVYSVVMFFYIACVLLAIFTFSASSGTAIGSVEIFKALLANSFSILATVTIAVSISLHFGKLGSLVSTYFFLMFISVSNSYFLKYPFLESFKEVSFGSIAASILYVFFPHLGVIGKITNGYLMSEKVEVSLLNEVGHFVFSYTVLIIITTYLFKKKSI